MRWKQRTHHKITTEQENQILILRRTECPWTNFYIKLGIGIYKLVLKSILTGGELQKEIPKKQRKMCDFITTSVVDFLWYAKAVKQMVLSF